MCKCKYAGIIWSSVFLALGTGILIASFIVPTVLLSKISDGLTTAARYNSPNSDASASSKLLTNYREDANPRYFSYYIYNITNINDVLTANAYPALQEVGPYAYRHYYQYYDYSWTAGSEGAEQLFTYKSYSWRVFQPDMSFYGSRYLLDSDVITTISPLYVSAFGGFTSSVIRTGATALPKDPTRSPLIPQALGGTKPYFERTAAEYRFRAGVAGVGMAGFVKKFNTLFTGKLPLVGGAIGPVIDSPLATAIHLLNTSHFLLNVNEATKYAVGNFTLTNDVLGALFLTGAVPQSVYVKYRSVANASSFEYWMPATRRRLSTYLKTNAGMDVDMTDPKYDISAAQANMLFTSLTTTPVPINAALTCSDWSLTQASYDSSQISCWALPLYVPSAPFSTAVTAIKDASGLTPDQIIGLWAWLRVVSSGEFINYLFDAGGHLGSAYNSPSSVYPSWLQPDFSAPVGGKWNNANLYVKKTVKDVLYESNSLLGYLFQSTAALPGSIGLFASSNRTLADDRLAVSPLYQVNSGIANIDSVDNLVLWNSASYLPTGNVDSPYMSADLKAGYQALANLTNGYPWSNKFFVEPPTSATFWQYPISQRNDAQWTWTKWTPTYAPGKKDSAFGFKNSDLDKSWILDLWNEDLIAHVPFSFWKDTSVYDIDTWRFTIKDSAYEPNLFLGQYCGACHNLTGAGKPVIFTPPRFQQKGIHDNSMVNTTCLATGTSDNWFGYAVPNVTPGFTINYLSDADLKSSDADIDPTALLAWMDMEPISGNLIRGSLKVQVNFIVSPAAGAVDPRSGVQKGYDSPYMGPQNSGDFMVFPYMWLNKKGQLTSKLADDFKFGVVGGRLAARIVLIVGTIVGGVMLVVSAIFLGIAIKKCRAGTGYDTQGSNTAVAL